MRILWDDEKNRKLISERGVGFEEVVSCIMNNEVLDVLKNPTRIGQYNLIVNLKNYTYAVPFLVNENEEVILKTIYPSRKLHKLYGRKK